MRTALACLVAIGLALASAGACAQDEPPVELAGTLAKVRSSGIVTLAHRESSIPFSYLSARGEPIGYSIELCRKLVDAMSEAVGRELAIQWLPVTSESRIDAITAGRADLECGSTTSNLERAKRVAFSPTIFVSGTKLLVKRGSAIRSFRDLRGRTVVVTAGTTNERALRDVARKFQIDMRLVAARDHADSFAQLAQGKADAFATDDVLLYGLLAQHRVRDEYAVVGEFLSYDPYGIMYRKGDPQMRELVNATFRALADDGEVERQYKRWFLAKLPSGERIDLPMSPQLETLIEAMAAKPE
ncbi:MAG TPA: amino acid ABC transporter substrate-binding protein [Usitatibacter sp.]|jgi:glutamate/aspartate transport system substrate-binding protein|nr:amino acid ABC transporter substrate-binding protein [Usitatibacter sp.]